MTQQTVLYTEMLTSHAVVHGDQSHLMAYSDQEHPIAFQVGGSEPGVLAKSAKTAEARGYNEINLNVGCPSERVQKGCFGAALMKEPALVAKCVSAMKQVVNMPVTVKTRLGVDEFDSEDFLHDFIGQVRDAGCSVFIIHARKAWLKGLSPKENRNVPPLCYERVYRLKQLFPELSIIINGGINTIAEAKQHLQFVDGVMMGRAVCRNPYLLAEVDHQLYGAQLKVLSREEVVSRYLPYMLSEYVKGVPMRRMTRHLIGLYQGQPGARQWRRHLSESVQDDRQLVRAVESMV